MPLSVPSLRDPETRRDLPPSLPPLRDPATRRDPKSGRFRSKAGFRKRNRRGTFRPERHLPLSAFRSERHSGKRNWEAKQKACLKEDELLRLPDQKRRDKSADTISRSFEWVIERFLFGVNAIPFFHPCIFLQPCLQLSRKIPNLPLLVSAQQRR